MFRQIFSRARMRAAVALVLLFLLLTAWPTFAVGQTGSLSERMAATVMTLWQDGPVEAGKPERWHYDMAVILKGFEGVWYNSGDGKYFNYIQRSIDRFVNDAGAIRTYKLEDYNIDNILPGRSLLLLYKVTGQDKYRKAAAHLREQLKTHPRTSEGGFWHKKMGNGEQRSRKLT